MVQTRRRAGVLSLAIVLLSAWSASLIAADAPDNSPVRAATQAIDPARRAEVSSAVLAQAREALAAADFVAARDRFLDVFEADRTSVEAMHGLALAHAALGDKAQAVSFIEKAVAQLERTGRKPHRPLLLNFCMLQISDRNTMRAARYLVDYLKAHPEPLDEPVINALGTALWNSSGTARTGTLWAQAEKLYTQLNARLEANNPGKKRWGVRWVTHAEHARLQRDWDQVAQARTAARDAWARHLEARKRASAVRQRRLIGLASVADMNSANAQVSSTRSAYERARDSYRQKLQTINGPDFPRALVAVPMDELTPPTAAQVIATLTSTEQTAPLRPQRTVTRRTPEPPQPAARPPIGPRNDDDEAAELDAPPPPPVVVPRQAGKRSVTRVAAAFPIGSDLFITSADAVAGAQEVQVSSLDGDTCKATVVRADARSGLALVRAAGLKLPPLRIAAAFRAGPVRCVSFAPMSIFDLKADLIAGGIRMTPDGPVLSLTREPRRSGAPLISGAEVVGVAVADRGSNPADLPLASLEQLRAFLGDDLPAAAGPFGIPEQVICELTATVQVQ